MAKSTFYVGKQQETNMTNRNAILSKNEASIVKLPYTDKNSNNDINYRSCRDKPIV